MRIKYWRTKPRAPLPTISGFSASFQRATVTGSPLPYSVNSSSPLPESHTFAVPSALRVRISLSSAFHSAALTQASWLSVCSSCPAHPHPRLSPSRQRCWSESRSRQRSTQPTLTQSSWLSVCSSAPLIRIPDSRRPVSAAGQNLALVSVPLSRPDTSLMAQRMQQLPAHSIPDSRRPVIAAGQNLALVSVPLSRT